MRRRILMVLVGLMCFMQTALALETNLVVGKVIYNDKGGEVVEEAKSASPGDILEYRLSIVNPSGITERALLPAIPIPESMVLIPESISPEKYLVSVDGKTYMSYPVLDAKGKEVDPSAYKRVRWNLGDLGPKEKAEVVLRARIDS